MTIKLHKFLFVFMSFFVFLLSSKISVEIKFLLLFTAFSFFVFHFRPTKVFFKTLVALVLVILFSLVSLFSVDEFVLYDLVQGLVYLSRPILALVIGFSFVYILKENYKLFYSAIITVGLISAAIHVFKTFPELVSGGYTVNELREVFGKSSFVEVVALVILLFSKDFYFRISRIKKFFFVLLIFVSIFMYFSRTEFLGLIVIILSVKGLLKVDTRRVFFIFFIVFFTFLFFSEINKIDLDRNAVGIDSLLYKIKIIPDEIFSTSIDINNKAELWDRWRSYEAVQAVEQVNSAGLFNVFFGMGASSLVDLGIVVDLGGVSHDTAPILHNGYAYVYFKAGILGVISYLFFLLYLYTFCFKSVPGKEVFVVNNIISGFSLYLFFVTFSITGIYNVNEYATIFLGGFLSIQKKLTTI